MEIKAVGLTGGIATGKSTVASLLREIGGDIVNADELAKEIVEPGKIGWQRVVEVFGIEILQKNKTINRDKLRKIIFNDYKERRKLESITHPLIRELANQRIKELTIKNGKIVVYEAPLLFENKIHLWLRPIILVVCDLDTQKQRLYYRDGLNEREIEQHIKAQMPLEEKRKLADYIIENNAGLEELRDQVRSIWENNLIT